MGRGFSLTLAWLPIHCCIELVLLRKIRHLKASSYQTDFVTVIFTRHFQSYRSLERLYKGIHVLISKI